MTDGAVGDPTPFGDDARLVEACVAGDEAARRALVRRHHAAVRRSIAFLPVARTGRVRPEDVEDAVQQAFIAFFAHDARTLAGWRGNASLRTYLCRVGERVARRHFDRVVRLRGRFRLDLDAPDPSGDARLDRMADEDEPTLDARIAEAETRAELRAAIRGALSEKGQTYYDYLFVEELDVGAIAEREGTNPNNVYQWKNRIVQAARAVLVKGGWLSGDDT